MPTSDRNAPSLHPMPPPMPMSDVPRGPGRTLLLAGACLGFALGGFFDGILLHQILQWHHLLSGLAGPAFADIRVQILADGLFHVVMYVIAAAGLWLLWRGRAALAGAGRGAGRAIAGWALLGFGTWHILDALLSHWLMGLHRIRMDVENKLFWDLLWFAVFGVAVLAAGWWLLRSGGGGPQEDDRDAALRRHRQRAVPLALVLAVLVAGPVAALPPAGVTTAMVLFRPGTSPAAAFGAVAAVQGRPVWSDPTGQLWAVDLPGGGSTLPLYGRGALLVSNGVIPTGCLNWFRTGPAPRPPARPPARSGAAPAASAAAL